eukprot:jgi/Ulvmu1/2046/UM120_0042.1
MEYPEEVDVVVLGTGFVQAVIACAAARRGKSLFILDAKESYGECGATLGWRDFQAWGQTGAGTLCATPEHLAPDAKPAQEVSEDMAPGTTAVPVPPVRPDALAVQFESHLDTEATAPRGFSLDLAHQALEATGPCAQAIRDIGLHHSLEFSAVSSVFTWHRGRLYSTPCSKADVHRAPWLSQQHRRTLSLFLANAQHAAAGGSSNLFQATHFKAALEDFGLHPSVQEGLLYSVFQAEDAVGRDTPLAGSVVLEAMVKFMSQSGAYVAGQAPYIESRYGCCEVAQAFARHACVHGGGIALGVPVSDILVREGAVRGVKTATGHVIRCSALFASPGYLGGFAQTATGANMRGRSQGDAGRAGVDENAEEAAAEAEEVCRRGVSVARGIVALRRPVLAHLTNCQIVFPPGACGNEHTVNVWHCHHTLGTCPAPGALLHLSMPRAEGEAALQALRACAAALLRVPDDSGATAVGSGGELGAVEGPVAAEADDAVMAECYYLQDLSGGDALELCEGAVCCPPAGREWTLDASLLLAERLFKKVFPDDVFLTKTPPVTAHPMKGEEEVDPLDAALKELGLD